MSSPEPNAYPEAEVLALTEALGRVLDACGVPHEIRPGVYSGVNLPELLADALHCLADEHGADALTEHRPGSWEANYVRMLAGFPPLF